MSWKLGLSIPLHSINIIFGYISLYECLSQPSDSSNNIAWIGIDLAFLLLYCVHFVCNGIGTVVRALAFHQFCPGQISGLGVTSGLSFLVLHPVLRGFPPGPLVFPSPQKPLLYSWRFSRHGAPLHWLVHGHMTSDNETVYRQMPWAGNIAKTMTSNRKQFTVTCEMLTAVARDQSVQLKVAWCCRKNLTAFCFCFVLLYNKSLNDWSLGKQWILFSSNLNVSLNFISGNTEILGKQNSLFPSGPVIKCLCLTRLDL